MISMVYCCILRPNIDLGSLIAYNNLYYLLVGNTDFWFFNGLEKSLLSYGLCSHWERIEKLNLLVNSLILYLPGGENDGLSALPS